MAKKKSGTTDADGNPIPRWRVLSEQEQQLAKKDEVKVTKEHTRALKEQNRLAKKQLHDHSAPKGVPVAKEDKKVLLAALKAIKDQIDPKKRPVREFTPGGVAADVLAGGGSMAEATQQALAFRKQQMVRKLKRKFDPLNIVHRLTGGSKLATALAGKVTGRSESAIRSAAGLVGGDPLGLHGRGPQDGPAQTDAPVEGTTAPQQVTTSTEAPTPTQVTTSTEAPTPTQVKGTSNTLLEQIAVTVSHIYELSKKRFDEEKDKTAVGKAPEAKLQSLQSSVKEAPTPTQVTTSTEAPTPTQVKGTSNTLLEQIAVTVSHIYELFKKRFDEEKDKTAVGKAPEAPEAKPQSLQSSVKESGGWGKFIAGWIDKLKLPLLAAIGLLIVAGTMLYKQWDNLKLSFTLLKESAVEMWESLKTAVSDAGTWIANKVVSIMDSFKNVFDSIGEFLMDMLHTVTFGQFGKKARTPEEKQADLEEKAKAGDAQAQRAIAQQHEAKESTESERSTATKKNAASFASKVQTTDKAATIEALKRGDFDTGAVKSLSGEAPPQGTPEQKATTGAITQLAAKSYGEVFKSADGKPLTPKTDTPENRATRIPLMVREASKSLAASLETGTVTSIPPAAIPASPTPQPAPPPQTGMVLTQAADNQRNAAGPAMGGGGGAMINNNVRNNQSNITNIQQAMPSARTGESSYLRSIDRGYVPA